MAFIYCITNNINGKQYVGKTHPEITSRWREHIRAARKSTMQHRPLYAAIQKYGVQNFTITQLEECADEQTIEREQYWIRQLNTYHNGYNATRGGDGKTYINREMVIETYQKLHNQKQTAKTLHISTDSVRDILRQAHIPVLTSPDVLKQKNSRPVDMLTLDGDFIQSFPSAIDAARYVTNKPGRLYGEVSHITDVCNAKRSTAYGYKWRFTTGQ